jgi:hypothetical protein
MARRIGAEFRPEHVAKPRQAADGARHRRRPRHRCALLAGEREGNVGPAHGEATHHVAHRFALGAIGLEKFQARRRGIEEVTHLDARALAERRRLHLGFDAALDRDGPGMRLGGVARRDGESRHRADRRQRLATEPERADVEEVVVGELRRGMALDRKREVRRHHAVAVVAHPDDAAAAAVGEHLDALGAGIERVLDQLFHHAGRTLHHLAGGDAVDHGFGELADGHGGLDSTSRFYRRAGEAARGRGL